MTTLAELAEAVKEIETLSAAKPDPRPSILSMFDSVFRPESVVDSEENK